MWHGRIAVVRCGISLPTAIGVEVGAHGALLQRGAMARHKPPGEHCGAWMVIFLFSRT
jgi:hypothetical protein